VSDLVAKLRLEGNAAGLVQAAEASRAALGGVQQQAGGTQVAVGKASVSLDDLTRSGALNAAGMGRVEAALAAAGIETNRTTAATAALGREQTEAATAAARQTAGVNLTRAALDSMVASGLRSTETLGRIEAAMGRAGTEGEAAAAKTDRYAAAAARVKAALDPTGAAQDRLNAELAEYQGLAAKGLLTTEQLAGAQALARRRYDETRESLDRLNKSGLTANQTQGRLNLTRQGADVFTTAAMGMNPVMIAIQQGPQILEAMDQAGIKASKSMLLVGGALGVVAAAVGVGTAAYLDHEKAISKATIAAEYMGKASGLTGSAMTGLAQEAAAAAGVSDKAGREMAAAFVATGAVGADMLGELIGLNKAYAAATGVDSTEATAALAKAMKDPVAALKAWNGTLISLNDAEAQRIIKLAEEGDLMGANRLLIAALAEETAGASEKTTEWSRSFDALQVATSNLWDDIGQGVDWVVDKVGAGIAAIEALVARVEGITPDWLDALDPGALGARAGDATRRAMGLAGDDRGARAAVRAGKATMGAGADVSVDDIGDVFAKGDRAQEVRRDTLDRLAGDRRRNAPKPKAPPKAPKGPEDRSLNLLDNIRDETAAIEARSAALIAGLVSESAARESIERSRVAQAGRAAVERAGLDSVTKLTVAQQARIGVIQGEAEALERAKIAGENVEAWAGAARAADRETAALMRQQAALHLTGEALDAHLVSQAGLNALRERGYKSLEQLTGAERAAADAAVASAEARETQRIHLRSRRASGTSRRTWTTARRPSSGGSRQHGRGPRRRSPTPALKPCGRSWSATARG
jgi:hypothetical protein